MYAMPSVEEELAFLRVLTSSESPTCGIIRGIAILLGNISNGESPQKIRESLSSLAAAASNMSPREMDQFALRSIAHLIVSCELKRLDQNGIANGVEEDDIIATEFYRDILTSGNTAPSSSGTTSVSNVPASDPSALPSPPFISGAGSSNQGYRPTATAIISHFALSESAISKTCATPVPAPTTSSLSPSDPIATVSSPVLHLDYKPHGPVIGNHTEDSTTNQACVTAEDNERSARRSAKRHHDIIELDCDDDEWGEVKEEATVDAKRSTIIPGSRWSEPEISLEKVNVIGPVKSLFDIGLQAWKYQCVYCTQYLPDIQPDKKHIAKHHPEEFECIFYLECPHADCNERFHQPELLETHHKAIHYVRCTECNGKFSDTNAMDEHLQVDHGAEVVTTEDAIPIREWRSLEGRRLCPSCGLGVRASGQHIRTHLKYFHPRMFHQIFSLACTYTSCKSRFDNEAAWRNHILIHDKRGRLTQDPNSAG